MTTYRPDQILYDADAETRKILQQLEIPEDKLFDYSASDNLYDDKLAPNLTEAEIEDAIFLRRFLRGLMVVTGDPGSGKGVLGHTLAWKIKRYFQGRKVLSDHKLKPAFGLYIPFDEQFLFGELTKMAKLSSVRTKPLPSEIRRGDKKQLEEVTSLAKQWVDSKEGKVYLSNSVLILEEFKRYFHNRRPMNPMGITLGHIATWWRHLDILIIGMTPFLRELDAISCLPYMSHEVRCSWTVDNLAMCNIYQSKWVSSHGVLVAEGKPTTIFIDGLQSRPELNGKRYVDLYDSKFLPSTMTP